MNKFVIGFAGFAVLLMITCMGACSKYNNMVSLSERTCESWSKVQSAYQRRTDLINTIVNVIKGSAKFEKSTLIAVIDARSQASIKIDPSNMTQTDLDKFEIAQDSVNSAFNKLMLVVEKYPDLKTTAQFRELMSQIEGTENRILVARNNFNESTNLLNIYIKKFPNNIYASAFGFTSRAYFQADSRAQNTPSINFEN